MPRPGHRRLGTDLLSPERRQHVKERRKIKRLRARELRNNPTEAERILWMWLSGDRLGVRFRRQYVMLGYILDFYCSKANLAVEVDGGCHAGKGEYDERRTTHLEEAGVLVVRFSNEEVLGQLDSVVALIRALLKKRLPNRVTNQSKRAISESFSCSK
jgi:very-short-patch-repair endonuclease